MIYTVNYTHTALECVQPQFDLGQTGQMDLFAPIMEEAEK